MNHYRYYVEIYGSVRELISNLQVEWDISQERIEAEKKLIVQECMNNPKIVKLLPRNKRYKLK